MNGTTPRVNTKNSGYNVHILVFDGLYMSIFVTSEMPNISEVFTIFTVLVDLFSSEAGLATIDLFPEESLITLKVASFVVSPRWSG